MYVGSYICIMEKKIINTTGAPAPIGPYNQAIQYGNILYISGQIPMNPVTGAIVSEDIKEETEQVMKNLQAILSAAGAHFGNVLKTSIFLIDMGQFSSVNEVYGKYFGNDAPARETVQVAGLPRGVNVEISMIAAL